MRSLRQKRKEKEHTDRAEKGLNYPAHIQEGWENLGHCGLLFSKVGMWQCLISQGMAMVQGQIRNPEVKKRANVLIRKTNKNIPGIVETYRQCFIHPSCGALTYFSVLKAICNSCAGNSGRSESCQ